MFSVKTIPRVHRYFETLEDISGDIVKNITHWGFVDLTNVYDAIDHNVSIKMDTWYQMHELC